MLSKVAILSVYDKTGLLDLVKDLVKLDTRIIASGGTARAIREAQLPVEDVSSVTKSPEMYVSPMLLPTVLVSAETDESIDSEVESRLCILLYMVGFWRGTLRLIRKI